MARQKRENIAGQLYFISKEDVLENGRPPSDKYVEYELTQDPDWQTAQKEYSEAKSGSPRKASVLVRGLEFKLDSLRNPYG